MRYAFIAAVTALFVPGQVQAPINSKVAPVYVAPKLEVREFSGDLTQWGPKAAIGKGGLQKEFRWTSSRKAATARYEITVYPFSEGSQYQPVTPLTATTVVSGAAAGAGSFTINFAPALQSIFATSTPAEHARFYVRLVLFDAANKPLSPVSNTAVIDYAPPSGGTKLDSMMVLRLKSARCIRQTSGIGSDDIRITIIGAANSNQGYAKYLFQFSQDGIPDTWAIAPGHPLWTYTGLGFNPDVHIVASVVENDDDPQFVAVGVQNAGAQTAKVVAQFGSQTCHDGDSCLGGPQVLAVTAADWQKVALGKQTITKRLRHAGDGALYELIFELAPK